MKVFTVFAMSMLLVCAVHAESMKLADPLGQSVNLSETTLDDQTDVAVTVYNNNLGLVRDQRKVSLLPGEITLKFMDVAQQIRPESVSLRSLNHPGDLRIFEQNYEYDLMSPAKLMEKYVGKKVRLMNFDEDLQQIRDVDAELLSVNQGAIYKVDGDIYLGHPGTVVLPEIPENLIAKPTLLWQLGNDASEHEIEVTYLTNGITWRADYVLTLNDDDTQFDIDGWVTLDNRSGAQYTNAKLKLVAGEVHMAPQRERIMEKRAMGMSMAPMMMEDMPQEESFAEYHLYMLPRRTTIKENQSKQVSLLKAAGVSSRKIYEYRGQVHYYSARIDPVKTEKIGVFVLFKNEEENQLGMPLPGGVLRIYKADSEGALQFAGEDRIDHTPKDEEVRLQMGNAFDIVGERIQKDYAKLGNNSYEVEFEITIRNHKEEDIVVDVVEPMPADWDILSASQKYVKKDAHTAVFSLDVPQDGETVLTYRVRVRY